MACVLRVEYYLFCTGQKLSKVSSVDTPPSGSTSVAPDAQQRRLNESFSDDEETHSSVDHDAKFNRSWIQ